MSITLRHPVTGRTKILPQGWSWGFFLGTGLFGIPFFLRGLPIPGAGMTVFSTFGLILALSSAGSTAAEHWVALAGLGLSVFFGMKANGMVIERHLKHGWVRSGSDWQDFDRSP